MSTSLVIEYQTIQSDNEGLYEVKLNKKDSDSIVKNLDKVLKDYINKPTQYSSNDNIFYVYINRNNKIPDQTLRDVVFLPGTLGIKWKNDNIYLLSSQRSIKKPPENTKNLSNITVKDQNSVSSEREKDKFTELISSFDFEDNYIVSSITYEGTNKGKTITVLLTNRKSKSPIKKSPIKKSKSPVKTPQKKSSSSRSPKKKVVKKGTKKKPEILTYEIQIEIAKKTSKKVINKFWKDTENDYREVFGDKITFEVEDDKVVLTIPKGRYKVETINKKVDDINQNLSYPKGIKLIEA